MSRWSVVTVTYNSEPHIRRHWSAPRDDREFEWIVVDNGSSDGTLDLARRHADLLIESGGNVGFSKGNNLGLDAVQTEYVAFVNPDVGVSGSDWQAEFERVIANTGGFVAPQLLNTDGTEQDNARGIPFFAAKVRNRLRPAGGVGRDYARNSFTAPTFCAWVMGAAIAGRTEDARAIGGWNENYFLYYEDHDFGLRAWKNRLPVTLDPAVRWTHDWERATTELNLFAWRAEVRSMVTFYSRYPEFFLGDTRSVRAMQRVRKNHPELTQNLWTHVPSAPQGD